MSTHRRKIWSGLLGIELSPVSHAERLVSILGGFLGIFAILQVSIHFVGIEAATLIVASMGASAVLLFAVPQGALSQPWPIIGGHLVSAVVGVTCANLVPNMAVAAALAVSLAIGTMHYLRCIHPPGGATALSAVIGGASVNALGYQFVVTPVLLNALVLLLVAVVFNYPFKWRRYPSYLKGLERQGKRKPSEATISHSDLVYALSEVDSFIDVSEKDLLAIYDLATRRPRPVVYPPESLQLGRYYSNGKYGADWSVRQIVDQPADGESASASDMLIYRVVAGAGLRFSGVVTREEFSRWARYEVYRDDENWRRVDADDER